VRIQGFEVDDQLRRAIAASPDFAESYNTYLGIRSKSTEDPLVPEVKRRVARAASNP